MIHAILAPLFAVIWNAYDGTMGGAGLAAALTVSWTAPYPTCRLCDLRQKYNHLHYEYHVAFFIQIVVGNMST